MRGTTGASAESISQTADAKDANIIPAGLSGPPAPAAPAQFHDQDPTPRASDPWRFTPSLLDPNSYAYNAFAQNAPGLFTPNPANQHALFQSQAGDLHSPTMGMLQGVTTPLHMPGSGEILGSMAPHDVGGFQTLQPHQLHHFNPFVAMPQAHQQDFVTPSSFSHQDTGYETMEQDGSPMDSDAADKKIPSITTTLQTRPSPNTQMTYPLPPAAEKFRFHSTLNAPTAMIKHSDEIPITYLNKGQAYALTVADTNAKAPVKPGTQYRTFVRVSFEDEEQRQKPSVCWGLWKEGRGTNEAHLRGGKLQAVEFVEAGQPPEGETKKTRIEVETASFDGFCVTWTPGSNGVAEVSIPVRFNFLSTDFSHSKGVKGIPVRLCAKTTVVSGDDDALTTTDTKSDVCFCKVKLFRDHGAERKLSNDVAHIKKSIDKLKQQIAQAESGMKDTTKRKRQSLASKASTDPRGPGKTKHKRTWSMSSTSSAADRPKLSLEEDLHIRLQTLQDMFTSTRPMSILFLRGELGDDPDLHPVSLPGDHSPFGREGRNWQARSGQSSVRSSLVSPSPSSLSLASQASTGPWQNYDNRGPDHVTTVSTTDDSGNLTGWIEALGVDPSYRPPLDRSPKPVVCFYVLLETNGESEKREYHRAVYLAKRSLEDLKKQIAAKWDLDSSSIRRAVHVLQNGLEVEVDDDVVHELKEGQDMRLQVEEVFEQSTTSPDTDETMGEDGTPNKTTSGIVLRLMF